MSYQVLARKWRPKRFREMAGQEHVLQAIINGLDHDRLHHAYLFTGTRGVGKTTIARIFAKCLNCESGVSSEPCGTCDSCTEINENRFLDLIEVDAASRTKVEDTRELLENVQYAPTKGRYKVYLIDEVHMLSNSSFNALLKTLEEPPPHVKFLLATTDPQKLPATVLSRCLQFNLKNLSPERIVTHLKDVLSQEMVQFDESALWMLGRAANGSMRDALSLTDQAIAFGSGKVLEADVSSMLGTIDNSYIVNMLNALGNNDGNALLAAVDHMSEHSPDYEAALESILILLHRITVAQIAPNAVDNSQGDKELVLTLAQTISAADVQLFYQLGLHGRRDLPLAPDARSGFEMCLLRMMAFRPQTADVNTSAQPMPVVKAEDLSVKKSEPVSTAAAALAEELASKTQTTASLSTNTQQAKTTEKVQTGNEIKPAISALDMLSQTSEVEHVSSPTSATIDEETVPFEIEEQPAEESELSDVIYVEEMLADRYPEPDVTQINPAAEDLQTATIQTIDIAELTVTSWPHIYKKLDLSGVAKSVVSHCALVSVNDECVNFVLDDGNAGLFNASYNQRLEESLGRLFGVQCRVEIAIGQTSSQTPAELMLAEAAERLRNATALIENDPNVQALMNQFDATILNDTIEAFTEK